VRVDLSRVRFWSVHTRDHIYLDEEVTERTRAAFEEIANAVAGDHSTAGRGCVGAREFWQLYNWPWNRYHELDAQICGDAKTSALVVFARGKRESFQFPDESPVSFAGILTSAMDQVKRHRAHLHYLPSIENARRTLPGMLPSRAYPELTNSIPPATTAPGPLSDPPVAWTLFTV
jgi:hypothetical protein